MSGIYFHIPFCKKKCSYCDFYKTTDNSKINDFLDAVKLELWLRRNYLSDKEVKTIYFGGGTPSLLSPIQFKELISTCKTVFKVIERAEITIEANPDDLSLAYLKELKNVGINRLSIGIQSLSNNDLKFMNRRHDSTQAKNAVNYAKQAGFDNISVDLIYGIPEMSQEQWDENLNIIFNMDVQHISAYHLTYHQGTQLWTQLQQGKIHEIEEKESIVQFEKLNQKAKESGFIHYEISNFCKEGFYSKHNSSYWNQTEYLGLGPSAHSYDKNSRQWNIANVSEYLQALKTHKLPFESEILTINDRFNDYIITSLRTIWGLDLAFVESEFGDKYLSHLKKTMLKFIDTNTIEMINNKIILSSKGWFVSDSIMSDLMI